MPGLMNLKLRIFAKWTCGGKAVAYVKFEVSHFNLPSWVWFSPVPMNLFIMLDSIIFTFTMYLINHWKFKKQQQG